MCQSQGRISLWSGICHKEVLSDWKFHVDVIFSCSPSLTCSLFLLLFLVSLFFLPEAHSYNFLSCAFYICTSFPLLFIFSLSVFICFFYFSPFFLLFSSFPLLHVILFSVIYFHFYSFLFIFNFSFIFVFSFFSLLHFFSFPFFSSFFLSFFISFIYPTLFLSFPFISFSFIFPLYFPVF